MSEALTKHGLLSTVDLKLRRPDPRMTSSSTPSSGVKMSDEIRRIVDDYSATLNKATAEIKALTKKNAAMEKSYEDLMEVNEKLIQDLVRILICN
jgi:hypothetical protein